MGGIGFGKRPQPRKFDYLPRFYDPIKEDLENRIGAYKEDNKEAQLKDRIKQGLRQRYNSDVGSYRTNQVKRSNMRLLYIIGILIMAAYLLLKSQVFERFMTSFTG